jgi:uncharacterized membrane protein
LHAGAAVDQAGTARVATLEDEPMTVLAFGGTSSGIYKLFFLLHIVSIVAAFAPAFAHPVLERQSRSMAPGARQQVLGFMAANSKRIYAPALVAAGAFGILLIVASDEAWEFSDGWVSFAFLVWIGMNAVLHALLLPAERKLAGGDEAARPRVDLGGQVLTLLFLVMLWLMIWKPGA